MATKAKVTREKLYKSLQLSEVKTVDEQTGEFEGFLAFFGNTDKTDDVIERGAFKKTIAESKAWAATHKKAFILPILWQHNRDVVLGGFTEATETDKGLYVKGVLDISCNEFGIPNNAEATKAYSGLKIGYIDEMSIGYYVIKREFKDGLRLLKELSVFEGSLVTTNMACNPEALVTSVKTNTNDTGERPMSTDLNIILRALRGARQEHKDFASRYADAQAQDCLTDWYDLQSSLRQASIDLFTMGDQPMADAEVAIEQFRVAYLAWIQDCMDAKLSEYLANQQSNGSMSYMGYMTNGHETAEVKAGKPISSKNMDTIKTAVAGINTHTASLQELLDEYNVSNNNSNKTIEPPNSTQAGEPPKGTQSEQKADTDVPPVNVWLEEQKAFMAALTAA